VFQVGEQLKCGESGTPQRVDTSLMCVVKSCQAYDILMSILGRLADCPEEELDPLFVVTLGANFGQPIVVLDPVPLQEVEAL